MRHIFWAPFGYLFSQGPSRRGRIFAGQKFAPVLHRADRMVRKL